MRAVDSENSFDVQVTGYAEGSTCFLAGGSNQCQANVANIEGPYSALVTLQINVVNTTDIPSPFTLILNTLGSSYAPSEVSINLNPTAPAGLDTSVLTGFDFDGSFSKFVRIQDLAKEDMGIVNDYIGWTVVDGGSVTFRFDVSTSGGMRGSPEFFMNAIPVVVPEPGTALLLGLGLAGLAAAGRGGPIQNALEDDLES